MHQMLEQKYVKEGINYRSGVSGSFLFYLSKAHTSMHNDLCQRHNCSYSILQWTSVYCPFCSRTQRCAWALMSLVEQWGGVITSHAVITWQGIFRDTVLVGTLQNFDGRVVASSSVALQDCLISEQPCVGPQ